MNAALERARRLMNAELELAKMENQRRLMNAKLGRAELEHQGRLINAELEHVELEHEGILMLESNLRDNHSHLARAMRDASLLSNYPNSNTNLTTLFKKSELKDDLSQ